MYIHPLIPPLFPPPIWPCNVQLITLNEMILPELEIFIDTSMFLVNVIEVDPRYKRIAMSVRTLAIAEPHETIVIRTFLMQPWGDRDRRAAPSVDMLTREMLGFSEPSLDFRPSMIIINYLLRGGQARLYYAFLRPQNPHVMVLMETRVTEKCVDRIIPTLQLATNYCVPAIGFASGI